MFALPEISLRMHALSNRTDEPHRRHNALAGEWVLVSPHRMRRPWQGQTETPAPERRPRHDPTCYLCPGNERAGGIRNPLYTGPFAFDNDFAALVPIQHAGDANSARSELLVSEPESGRCRVVCFSPRHDLSLPDLTTPEIRAVVDLWTDEYLRLGADADIGHVQIFENKGEAMGCSNPHPHGQIWAQRSVPGEPSREGERQRAHHERHGRT